MRIFTNEEKLNAIELYIKYDFSPGAVMYELGYPTARSMIYRWYKTYKANGNMSTSNFLYLKNSLEV